MDLTARAHELIEVTESLTALIERENELLQELRIKEIKLCNGKTSLSGLYEPACEKLSRIPASSMLSRLKSAYACASEAFNQSAKRNANALRAALEMNTRMVHKIANLASRQETRPNGYGAAGTVPYPTRRARLTVAPMTLNQQL